MDRRDSSLSSFWKLPTFGLKKPKKSPENVKKLYEPLRYPDSVRLLLLEPGDNKAPIVASLYMDRLSGNPTFDAVSYVWGDPKVCEFVTVNGHEVPITVNLSRALRQIRPLHRSLCLWVDQICIHQDHVVEQTHQVKLMAKIFKHAAQVFICLGAEAESCAPGAHHLINALRSEIDAKLNTFSAMSDLPSVQWEEVQHYEALDWKSLRRMSRCEWFKRAWCVQEVGLAKKATIAWGSERIDWMSLMKVQIWLRLTGINLARSHNVKRTPARMWVSFAPEYRHLDDNLSLFNNFVDLIGVIRGNYVATDPRDFLFAFLGHPLAKDIGFTITPDYEQPSGKIFSTFATNYLKTARDPLLLTYVSHKSLWEDKSVPDLVCPSWVPQWNSRARDQRSLNRNKDRVKCNASTGHEDFIFEIEDGQRLVVGGFLFDTIKEIFPVFSSKSFRLPLSNSEANIMPHMLNKLFASKRRESLVYDKPLEAFIRTVYEFAFAIETRFVPPKLPEFASYLSLAIEQAKPSIDLPAQLLADLVEIARPQGRTVNIAEVTEDMRISCQGRRFFITANGYVGLAPNAAAQGDMCCVFFGSIVPFTLRPLEDGTYLFVGECYVQGIMNGEAMEKLAKGERKRESFVVR